MAWLLQVMELVDGELDFPLVQVDPVAVAVGDGFLLCGWFFDMECVGIFGVAEGVG